MVLVTYKGELKRLAGRDSEEIEVKTVADVLNHIKHSYGEKAYKEAKVMLITVNGTSITLMNSFKTKLKDGGKVGFFPICGGG